MYCSGVPLPGGFRSVVHRDGEFWFDPFPRRANSVNRVHGQMSADGDNKKSGQRFSASRFVTQMQPSF
jgi:hypothetical protein